jgi:hypothetical protein
MGWAKDEMMRHQDQLVEATEIAVQAGVLKRCEFHDDIVWDVFGDHAEAYKIGNARFTAGELRADFRSRRELTDAIKAAIEHSGVSGCPLCAKLLED